MPIHYFVDVEVQILMDRLGIKTKQHLADRLGVTQGLISQWSSGKSFPSYHVIKQLFMLGATVEELFGVDYTAIQAQAMASLNQQAANEPAWAAPYRQLMERLEKQEKLLQAYGTNQDRSIVHDGNLIHGIWGAHYAI